MTKQQQDQLDQKIEKFDAFLEERMSVLTEFFELIQVEDPAGVLVEARNYMGIFDAFMQDQEVSPESRTWILTVTGYLLGEYFVQEFSGSWYVQEDSQSRYFAHYVVGNFSGMNEAICIDPFEMAITFVDSPAPRSIPDLILEVGAEMNKASKG